MAKNNTGTITWIIIGVIVILLILGYFWYSQKPSTPTTTPQNNIISGPGTHNIEISNLAFSAPALIVKTGDTVVWTNKDTISHTVTSDTGNEMSSLLLKPGDTYSHTFNTVGTFNYHCEVHPSMKASITVE